MSNSVTSAQPGNAANLCIRASDIPSFCTKIARLLQAQHLFKGYGAPVKNCKVISLPSFADAQICGIFSKNAMPTIEERKEGAGMWHIAAFGSGNVMLCLYENIPLSSIEELEKRYEQVYASLITGWTLATPDEHPNIMFKEHPNYYSLYIKSEKETLINEGGLLRFLSNKFNLKNSISCMNNWKVNSKQSFGDTYLWVRKTDLDKVRDILGLKLNG